MNLVPTISFSDFNSFMFRPKALNIVDISCEKICKTKNIIYSHYSNTENQLDT